MTFANRSNITNTTKGIKMAKARTENIDPIAELIESAGMVPSEKPLPSTQTERHDHPAGRERVSKKAYLLELPSDLHKLWKSRSASEGKNMKLWLLELLAEKLGYANDLGE